MNDIEVDMDELEARLYGQVYHTTNIEEDYTPTCQIPTDIPVNNFPRYYKEHASKPPNNTFYSLDRIGLYPFSVINPPINNIVVLPPQQTQIFTRPQQNSQKWIENLLEKCEKERLKSKRKHLRRKLKRKERNKQLRQLQSLEKVEPLIKKTEEITTDITANITTVKKESVLVLDDSDTNSNTSDVVLIEIPNEVITIDSEEVENSPFKVPDEATTNDCLNVSLIKPDDLSDISSNNSSTIDYTENFCGTKVFNEVSTRSSNSFSELNLDSFTTYMEHNGKNSDKVSTLSKSLLEMSNKRSIENSSDSSSESEYEKCDLETVSDVSISNYTPTKKTTVVAVEAAPVDVNVDCQEQKECVEDSPTIKKMKLDVIEIDTTSNDISDIVLVDDDSMSSVEVCLNESDREVINSKKILNVERGDINYPAKEQENKSKRFMDYWTDDMDKFYNESWGHEGFNVPDQQKHMSDNPNMWKILPSDRVNLNCYIKQPRCRRCRQFGHITAKCTQLWQPPKCILCGASGHLETRCPHTVCTSCGRQSNYFTTHCSGCTRTRHIVCSICKMKGHMFNKCPDLWRRYLFTTTEGSLVQQPEGAHVKQSGDRWCSGCAGNGHFEQSCYYYNRTHLPVSVHIHDYTDVHSSQASSSNSQRPIADLNETHPVIENPITKTTVSNSRFSWDLTLKDRNRLQQHGSIFLKTLGDMLKIKVKIIGEKCQVIGSKKNKSQAKSAIKRFCTNFKLLRLAGSQNFSFKTDECTKKSLRTNLNYLENFTINWRRLAGCIFDLIKLNGKRDRAKEFYRKLNAIINGKLQVGVAKLHMMKLRRCLQEDKAVVVESFQYIFNNSNKIFKNYESLMQQLPCKDYNVDNPNRVEVERLKKMALEACSRDNFEIVENLYNIAVINNYSDVSVTKFKDSVWCMLSNVDMPKCGRLGKRKSV